MNDVSFLGPRAKTLNARVGAIALALGGFATLLLTHTTVRLAPLRLLALALCVFAAWAFCDEMGLRKPLNRAGFVLFAIAVGARVQWLLGVPGDKAPRYAMLYAAFLMAALLFWSAAFLHRQRALKVVGALGVAAAATPIVALIVGHLVLGAGAFLGVGGLLAASNGAGTGDYAFVTVVERVFGLWGYAAAWMLWRGHIQPPSAA